MLTASLASSAKTLRHFDDRFPEVLTGEDAAEGCRDMLYALDDVHFEFHARSEEHTSELQSQSNLVCRLLLEKKTATKRRETLPQQLNVARRQQRNSGSFLLFWPSSGPGKTRWRALPARRAEKQNRTASTSAGRRHEQCRRWELEPESIRRTSDPRADRPASGKLRTATGSTVSTPPRPPQRR